MGANIRASQHMWRYDYTSEYVMRRVNATSGDPELSAYRPNGTECAAAAAAGRGGGGTAAFSGADGAAIRFVFMYRRPTLCEISVHRDGPSQSLVLPCSARCCCVAGHKTWALRCRMNRCMHHQVCPFVATCGLLLINGVASCRWLSTDEGGQHALRNGGAGAAAALCLLFCWRVVRRRAGRRRLQAGPRHA